MLGDGLIEVLDILLLGKREFGFHNN